MTNLTAKRVALAALLGGILSPLALLPAHADTPAPARVGSADTTIRHSTASAIAKIPEGSAGSAKVASVEGAGFQESFSPALRLRFEVRNAQASRPYKIRFVGSDGEKKLELSAAELAASPSVFWTPDLGTYRVDVFVDAPQGRPVGLDFDITGRSPARATVGTFDSRVGDGYSEDITRAIGDKTNPLSAAIRQAATGIGRVSFLGTDGTPLTCSGFLISPTRFLTNNHCVSTQTQCMSATVWFNNVRRTDGSIDDGRPFNCSRLIRTDKNLDLSILELSGAPGPNYQILAIAADNAAAKEDALIVVHHPNGWPKQVSRQKCRLVARNVKGYNPTSDLAHSCHTSWGSSGSPVLLASDPNQYVGLHHLGCGEEVCPTGKYNRAVMIEALRSLLGP